MVPLLQLLFSAPCRNDPQMVAQISVAQTKALDGLGLGLLCCLERSLLSSFEGPTPQTMSDKMLHKHLSAYPPTYRDMQQVGQHASAYM